MANIDLFLEDDLPDWLVKIVNDELIPMLERINPTVLQVSLPDTEGMPENIAKFVIEEAIANQKWGVSVLNNGDAFTIQVSTSGMSFEREILMTDKIMYHSFFHLNDKLQGKGLSQEVLALSDKIIDAAKLESVVLSANIDVGGYAWLRKGFFPDGGVPEFIKTARDSELKEKLLRTIEGMSEADVRKYVLSQDFRQYKELYLGSFWNGSLDANDPLSRAAFRYGAEAAQKSIPARLAVTANQKIMDRYIKHQIDVLRYATGLATESAKKLVDSENPLRNVLFNYLSDIPNRQLTGIEGRQWQRNFEVALRETRTPVWSDIATLLQDDLKQFAIQEAASAAAVIEGSVPVILGLSLPPSGQLISVVNSQPFEGRTLKQWVERTAEADIQRMLTAAKTGIINGRTPTDVARGIAGTVSRPRDSVARKAFNDIESVLLTLTNGIQQEAKQALYEQNSDIISKERYLATLDSRTTLECAEASSRATSLGQGIYNRGQGPIPPLHFRCRSLRVPYFGPNDLASRPFDPTTEKQLLREYTSGAKLDRVKSRDSLPRGHKTKFDKFAQQRKRELVGQVPADLNYGDWLRTQSIEFQDEVLGSVRAAMFRENNLTLSSFVNKQGDTLNLEQLKQRGIEAP